MSVAEKMREIIKSLHPKDGEKFEALLFNTLFESADYARGDTVIVSNEFRDAFAGLFSGGRLVFSDTAPSCGYFVKLKLVAEKPTSPVKISTWYELANVAESDTHRLEIEPENGNGWIISKATGKPDIYLSTHTFYGSQYQYSTKELNECGFNVELANWDEKAKA